MSRPVHRLMSGVAIPLLLARCCPLVGHLDGRAVGCRLRSSDVALSSAMNVVRLPVVP